MTGPDARRSAVPMFHVPDVRRTVAWYRDVGFELRESYGDAGSRRASRSTEARSA